MLSPVSSKIETIDKDGDGGVHAYSDDDRQILGHQNPNWILGLNNTFQYKRVRILSVFMMGRFGQTISSNLPPAAHTAKIPRTRTSFPALTTGQRAIRGAYYPRPEQEANRYCRSQADLLPSRRKSRQRCGSSVCLR